VLRLEQLAGELDAAHKATSQAMNDVEKAKRTAQKAKRSARIKQRPDYNKEKRTKHS
jgi:hypothetical protein